MISSISVGSSAGRTATLAKPANSHWVAAKQLFAKKMQPVVGLHLNPGLRLAKPGYRQCAGAADSKLRVARDKLLLFASYVVVNNLFVGSGQTDALRIYTCAACVLIRLRQPRIAQDYGGNRH
jgi:hypothetical protein